MAVTRDEILDTTGLESWEEAGILFGGMQESDILETLRTMTNDETGLDDIASSIAHELDTIEVGTTLLTKDGRQIGNAIVISDEFDTVHRAKVYTIETDFGNRTNLTEEEIRMDFHISRQTSLERWRTDKHNLIVSNSGFDMDSLDAIEWKAIGAITPEDQATIYKLIKSTIARLGVSADIVRAKLQTYFDTTGLKTEKFECGTTAYYSVSKGRLTLDAQDWETAKVENQSLAVAESDYAAAKAKLETLQKPFMSRVGTGEKTFNIKA